MDNFGCCSSYVECSDALSCIHSDNPEYAGCKYMKNLYAGKIFYGKNAGKHVLNNDNKAKRSTGIFLFCWDRLFAIRAKNKNGWSYKLSPEQEDVLKVVFDDNFIPFMTECDSTKCFIDKPEQRDNSPANSRVVLKIYEQAYHILNYNDYLIKKRYAEKIVAAFKGKGFDCSIELVGMYSNVGSVSGIESKIVNHVTTSIKPVEEIKATEPKEAKHIRYEQESIFKLMARCVS